MARLLCRGVTGMRFLHWGFGSVLIQTAKTLLVRTSNLSKKGCVHPPSEALGMELPRTVVAWGQLIVICLSCVGQLLGQELLCLVLGLCKRSALHPMSPKGTGTRA